MDAGTAEEIQRALSLLPMDQREAFVLKHVEDLSYEEMSDFTGVGVSALKMRVKRACERLRSILQEVPQ
jgi:RNA polymerase sigma-70 factor (ECF subfamily)